MRVPEDALGTVLWHTTGAMVRATQGIWTRQAYGHIMEQP